MLGQRWLSRYVMDTLDIGRSGLRLWMRLWMRMRMWVMARYTVRMLPRLVVIDLAMARHWRWSREKLRNHYRGELVCLGWHHWNVPFALVAWSPRGFCCPNLLCPGLDWGLNRNRGRNRRGNLHRLLFRPFGLLHCQSSSFAWC